MSVVKENFYSNQAINSTTSDATGNVDGNKLIAIVDCNDADTRSCTGVQLDPSGTPQAFTKIGSQAYTLAPSTDESELSIWYLDKPATGSSKTVRATAGATTDFITLFVFDLSKAALGDVYDYDFSVDSATTTTSRSLTSDCKAGSIGLSGVICRTSTTITSGGGQTIDVSSNFYAAGSELETAYGTTSQQWNFSGSVNSWMVQLSVSPLIHTALLLGWGL